MQPRRRALGGAWFGLLAFSGLLAGHLMSYLFVAPDAHERHHLLQSTGHAAHDLFGPSALAALLAATIGAIVQQLRRRADASRRPPRPFVGTAAALWAIQTVGFVLLEGSERLQAGQGLADLVMEPAFLVGLVAQAVVAVVGALLIRFLRATVEAIRRLIHGGVAEPAAVAVSSGATSHPLLRNPARAAWNLRGPPLLDGTAS